MRCHWSADQLTMHHFDIITPLYTWQQMTTSTARVTVVVHMLASFFSPVRSQCSGWPYSIADDCGTGAVGWVQRGLPIDGAEADDRAGWEPGMAVSSCGDVIAIGA